MMMNFMRGCQIVDKGYRPASVVWSFWKTNLVIPEDAVLFDPMYMEVHSDERPAMDGRAMGAPCHFLPIPALYQGTTRRNTVPFLNEGWEIEHGYCSYRHCCSRRNLRFFHTQGPVWDGRWTPVDRGADLGAYGIGTGKESTGKGENQ